MRCENRLCVYESEGKCILERVDIDSLGMCTECIYPTIDEEILRKAKERLLAAYKKSDRIQ